MFVDLGAEKLLTAEKEGRRIAVEVKSFVGYSEMRDLQNAVGQYQVYRSIMARTRPERTLYLAVSAEAFHSLFEEDVGSLVMEGCGISLIIFDDQREVIAKWIH